MGKWTWICNQIYIRFNVSSGLILGARYFIINKKYHKYTLKLCQSSVKALSKLCQSYVKALSNHCQRSVKALSKHCQSSFKAMSKLCQSNFSWKRSKRSPSNHLLNTCEINRQIKNTLKIPCTYMPCTLRTNKSLEKVPEESLFRLFFLSRFSEALRGGTHNLSMV